MNILHISPYVPSVHTGHAGGVCMGKQVEELRKHHTVFVLSFVNDEKDEELAIKEYSDGNSWFIKSSTVDKAGNALMHLNKPLFFSIRSSRSFKKRFLKILETYSIDVIHAEYTAMGQYYWVKKYYPNIQFNVVEHDVTRQSYERQVKDSSGLKRLFNVWQKNLVVSKEKEYLSHADTIFTFNEKDKTLLNSYYGFNNVRQLVPYYGVDFEHAFDKPVEKEKIMQILKAGMQAPSACNQQPWEFYVVTDKEKIEELSKATPYSRCAVGAPVVIVPVYRTKGLVVQDMAQIDMSIAQENIWLETDAKGLGGVWIGIAPMEERMNDVHRMLNLPEDVKVFSMFSLFIFTIALCIVSFFL